MFYSTCQSLRYGPLIYEIFVTEWTYHKGVDISLYILLLSKKNYNPLLLISHY